MNKFIRRLSAAFLAVSMLSAAVSCSGKNNDKSSSSESSSGGAKVVDGSIPDDASVAMEDLPYGATMVALKSKNDEKIKVDIEFDKRYFYTPDETVYPESYIISDYVYALQTADAELLESVFYKPYLEYSCKAGGYADTQAYIDENHSSLEEKLGENFILDYIMVDECYVAEPDEENSDFTRIDDTLKECAGEDILNKVSRRMLVYLEIIFKNEESASKMFSNTMGYKLPLYVYEIDGQFYAV